MMERRKPAAMLNLPYPLHPVPLGLPGTLTGAPLRDAFSRVSLHPDAPRRPHLPPPVDGAPEPAFLLRKRNERERQRVRGVNAGYARLRAHLPRELAGRRLSQVQTLRAAVRYIKHLQEMLERPPECNSDGESKASSAPSPCSETDEGGS